MGNISSSTIQAVTQSPSPPPANLLPATPLAIQPVAVARAPAAPAPPLETAALPLTPAPIPSTPAPPLQPTRFTDACRAEQRASLACQTSGGGGGARGGRDSRLEACVVAVDAYKRCMEEARKRRLAENNRNTGGDGSGGLLG
jgi:hypothetical protein